MTNTAQQIPAVTTLTHAELCNMAQGITLTQWLGGGETAPLTDELRGALGIADGETLALHVLVDRSGSVLADEAENRQQASLVQRLEASERPDTTVAITGFDGHGMGTMTTFLYECKLAGVTPPPAIARQVIRSVGGGGTPTAPAVAHATAELAGRDADHKLLLVITDGAAYQPEELVLALDAARAAGIRIVGGVAAADRLAARRGAETFGADGFIVPGHDRFADGLLHHLNPSQFDGGPHGPSLDADQSDALCALTHALSELAQATGEDTGHVRRALEKAASQSSSQTLRLLSSSLRALRQR